MPPRKPSSGRTPRGGDDPLLSEKQRLLEQQQELLRQQERARRLIEEAPRKLEQLKKRQREPIRIELSSGPRAGKRTFGAPHNALGGAAAGGRVRPRARKAERNLAKIQFVVSVVILAIIVFMILRTIPSM